MRINIELNTKELDILSKDNKEPVEYNFTIDLYTEARSELTAKEETIVYAGIFWALCTMLPSTIIHLMFKQWNDLVKELTEGLAEGKQVNTQSLNSNLK